MSFLLPFLSNPIYFHSDFYYQLLSVISRLSHPTGSSSYRMTTTRNLALSKIGLHHLNNKILISNLIRLIISGKIRKYLEKGIIKAKSTFQ